MNITVLIIALHLLAIFFCFTMENSLDRQSIFQPLEKKPRKDKLTIDLKIQENLAT